VGKDGGRQLCRQPYSFDAIQCGLQSSYPSYPPLLLAPAQAQAVTFPLAFGALKTISYGNGERLIITRGDDGRLDGRRLYKVADGVNISHLTYGYDVDDNMIRITDKLDATKSLSFAYDPVGRLKRVTAASGSMQRTDYVFDGNGNRLKKLTRPLPNDPPTAAVTETYQTSFRSNRLNAITSPAGTRNMSYDARGNLITETRPGGISIIAGYDGYGRLTSYSRTGEASLAHVYNGMDERVATTRGTDTRRFLYAPDGRVLGEYGSNANDVRAEFIWLSPEVGDSGMFGGDDGLGGYMPLAVATPTATAGTTQLAYVHASHMGVPIRYSDASGTTLAAPTGYSVPGFPGQSQTTADLYYNKYRDYDASTGRYVQADPIGLAGGASPYSYAMNNPMRYSDPTGEFVPLVVIGGRIALQCALNPACRLAVAGALTLGAKAIYDWNNNSPFNPVSNSPFGQLGGSCPPAVFGGGSENDDTGYGSSMASIPQSGTGNDCPLLIIEINRIRNELARRVDEYRLDPRGLPEGPGPGTRIGHMQQFQDKQKYLRRLLQQALAKGCAGYASDAWYYATRGL
jgi:RHS repeat-associated protein